MEADYNLAQVYLGHGRPDEALPLLEALLGQRPWESRFIHQLAHGYTQAGWHAQAVELLRRAYPEGADSPPPAVFLLMARACIGMGDKNAAAWYAARAASRLPVLSGACVELGNLELTLQNFPAAARAFRRALALDPSMASAHEGLSSVFLRTGENERALEAALGAVELIHQSAGAHLNLGIALARLGSFAEARAAFRRVTAMRPQHPLAWRFLAALPDDSAQGDFLAAACRENARRLSREWATQRHDERSRSRQLRPLPPLPAPAERLACAHAARPDRDFTTVAGPVGRTFTLVSGLPRSGTSLMMQMLEAGGLPPLTDGLRSADTDNPHGYYEWEPIKSIARQPDLLDADGHDRRAIKCISALLRSLPSKHRYRVIFMSRPIDEIVPSQERMKQRLGTTGAAGDAAAIAAVLTKHRDDTLLFLQQRPVYFEVLEIDYPSLVADPAPWIEKLTAFLGPELLPRPAHMAAAVQPALHRNRQANSL